VLRRRGRIQVRLSARERDALLGIISDLTPSLPEVRDALSLAYPEADLQAEYTRWVKPDYLAGCEADITVVTDSLSAGEDTLPLTEAQAIAWLRALNHLRIAAGDMLNLEVDGWEESVDETTRNSREFGILMALGYLQEELVAALES